MPTPAPTPVAANTWTLVAAAGTFEGTVTNATGSGAYLAQTTTAAEPAPTIVGNYLAPRESINFNAIAEWVWFRSRSDGFINITTVS